MEILLLSWGYYVCHPLLSLKDFYRCSEIQICVHVKGYRTGDVGDHDTYLFHTCYKTSRDIYLYVYNLIETI